MIVTETFSQDPDPPVAAFTESAHTAPAGTPISFDPSGSHALDGKIVLYEWDWESDGIYDESHETLMVVSRTFTIPGQYTVTLRVTDDKGFTDECSQTKTITPILQVIPEVPMGTIMATIALFAALLTAIGQFRRQKTKI
jgi:PKD repeat protein